MYYTPSDKHSPYQPVFTWRLGCSYAYHLPNRKERKQIIKAVSYHQANANEGYLPDELVYRISGVYDYYLLTLQDYKAQLADFRTDVLDDPRYSQRAKQEFLLEESKRLRQFKQSLAREVLKRIARRFREFQRTDKNLSLSIESLYLIISYVLAVRLPCNVTKQNSTTERLMSWLAKCWVTPSPTNNRDLETQLIDDFLALRFRQTIEQIDRLKEKCHSKQQKERFRVTKDLLVLKQHTHQNYEHAFLKEADRKKQLHMLQGHCQDAIDQYFPEKDPEDPCYIILAIMSGDLDAIKRVLKTDWKQYLLAYLSYCDPFVNFTQVHKILQEYLTEVEVSSEESELAQKLFKPSLHSVIQWALIHTPPVLAVTLGLICFDMGLMQTYFERDVLGCSYPHYLLGMLLDWMVEAEMQTAMVYARQYAQGLGSQEYREFFTNLISRKIQLRPITTDEQFQEVVNSCNNIYSLGLAEYLVEYTRSMVLMQIRNDSFGFVFDLLALYEGYSGIKDPLLWLRHQCDSYLRQNDLSCSKLTQAIRQLRPTCKFRADTVEKLFDLYIKLGNLTDASSASKFKELLSEVLEHPRLLVGITYIVGQLQDRLKFPDCNHYRTSLKMLESHLNERLPKETAIHQTRIQEILMSLTEMTTG